MKKHCGFGRQIIESGSDAECEEWNQYPEPGSRLLHVQSSPIMRLAS